MRKPDESGLDFLFEEWGTTEAPEDFAQRVLSAAQVEKTARRSRLVPRSVVVPLLLVALCISVGAAAAWDRWKPVRVGGSVEVTDLEVPRIERSSQLSFHMAHDLGHAVPEVGAVDSPRKSSSRVVVSDDVEPPPVDAIAVEPKPGIVHWPQCECGTSGVVCTCSD